MKVLHTPLGYMLHTISSAYFFYFDHLVGLHPSSHLDLSLYHSGYMFLLYMCLFVIMIPIVFRFFMLG